MRVLLEGVGYGCAKFALGKDSWLKGHVASTLTKWLDYLEVGEEKQISIFADPSTQRITVPMRGEGSNFQGISEFQLQA